MAGTERHSDRKQEYGPSWEDAAHMVLDLKKRTQSQVDVRITPTTSFNGILGWRVDVVDAVYGGVYGSCGFGKAYANGAKTMPSAIIHALVKAERYIDDFGTASSERPAGTLTRLGKLL